MLTKPQGLPSTTTAILGGPNLKRWPTRCALGVLMLAMASCTPDPAGDVGVGMGDGGQLELFLGLCDGDGLNSALVADPVDEVVGNDDDIVYWRIDRADASASSPTILEVGEVVEGFVSSGPTTPLPTADVELMFLVETDRESYFTQFTQAELMDGELATVSGERQTTIEFEENATADC